MCRCQTTVQPTSYILKIRSDKFFSGNKFKFNTKIYVKNLFLFFVS